MLAEAQVDDSEMSVLLKGRGDKRPLVGRQTMNLPRMSCLTMTIFLASLSAATITSGPDTVESDLDATEALIVGTRHVEDLCANFDGLLIARPSTGKRLDDEVLGDEFLRRFCDKGWSLCGPPAESNDLQVLSWIAECNKRMCVQSPEVRERQRDKILSAIESRLEVATAPQEVCVLLDIAYRTTFYYEFVVPRDGSDRLIDLFMRYVMHQDAVIHDFARDRLGMIGSESPTRSKEIRQFLVESAPEISERLTMEPVRGFVFDPLTPALSGADPAQELEWLSLCAMPPAELAGIIETRLRSDRSQDVAAHRALEILLLQGTKEHGGAGFDATRLVMRKGVRITEMLHHYAIVAAEDPCETPPGYLQERFDSLLVVFLELAQGQWPPFELKPTQVLQSILDEVRCAPGSASRQYIQARLHEALHAQGVSATK